MSVPVSELDNVETSASKAMPLFAFAQWRHVAM